MIRIIFPFIFVFFFLANTSNADAKTSYECCVSHATNPSACIGQDTTAEVACIPDIFKPAQFFDSPSSIFNVLLSNLLLIAGIILFLLVIVAGFQMIQAGSSGDAHDMEKWRTMLTYGVIGFVIILLAGVIIKLVETFTGINILDPEAVFNQ